MLKIFKVVFAKLIPKFPINQHKYFSRYTFEGLASTLNVKQQENYSLHVQKIAELFKEDTIKLFKEDTMI